MPRKRDHAVIGITTGAATFNKVAIVEDFAKATKIDRKRDMKSTEKSAKKIYNPEEEHYDDLNEDMSRGAPKRQRSEPRPESTDEDIWIIT